MEGILSDGGGEHVVDVDGEAMQRTRNESRNPNGREMATEMRDVELKDVVQTCKVYSVKDGVEY